MYVKFFENVWSSRFCSTPLCPLKSVRTLWITPYEVTRLSNLQTTSNETEILRHRRHSPSCSLLNCWSNMNIPLEPPADFDKLCPPLKMSINDLSYEKHRLKTFDQDWPHYFLDTELSQVAAFILVVKMTQRCATFVEFIWVHGLVTWGIWAQSLLQTFQLSLNTSKNYRKYMYGVAWKCSFLHANQRIVNSRIP